MTRRDLKWAAAALAVLLGAPLPAAAQSSSSWTWNPVPLCTTGSLLLCNQFAVAYDGTSDSYSLTVTNDAAGTTISDYGSLTGIGIYGPSSYAFDITSSDPTWTLIDYNTNTTGKLSQACNDLKITDVNSKSLLAGDCNNGSTNDVQTVTITFTSNTALTKANFDGGDVFIAGDHVQSIGAAGCSAKFYSNGTVTTTLGTTLDGCTTVTPEPATFVLLATGLLGLLGLGGVRRIRRRHLVDA